MNEHDIATLQLVLEGINVLVVPVLFGIGRWLMRVELRLSKLEWMRGGSHASAGEGDR